MPLYPDPHLPPVTVLPATGTSVSHGEVVAPAANTATQMPAVSALLVHIAAKASNVGNIYIGSSNAVTVPQGTTNATTGIEHTPGYSLGWFRVKASLDELWFTTEEDGDGVTYFVAG